MSLSYHGVHQRAGARCQLVQAAARDGVTGENHRGAPVIDPEADSWPYLASPRCLQWANRPIGGAFTD